MKLVIDFGDDDCVWIEVTQEEHDQLEHHAKAFRESSIFSAMVREAESYSRIVAWAAQGNLLPADWDYRRKRADATRLHGVTHEFVFGLPVRVAESVSTHKDA